MKLKGYFTKFELFLWGASALIVTISYCFSEDGVLSFVASLIGVTSLIFCAKGNPFGQVLIIIFSLLYGIISYSFSYYGEMLTYVFMTLPMAVFSLISWLRHPYGNNRSEVEVNKLTRGEWIVAAVLTAAVTVIFYFVLSALDTANLLPSTISVTTSFIAVYLTALRSPYYAIGYAANDIVLIILWLLASLENPKYISVVACFAAFLANDIYSFINWRKMEKRQNKS